LRKSFGRLSSFFPPGADGFLSRFFFDPFFWRRCFSASRTPHASTRYRLGLLSPRKRPLFLRTRSIYGFCTDLRIHLRRVPLLRAPPSKRRWYKGLWAPPPLAAGGGNLSLPRTFFILAFQATQIPFIRSGTVLENRLFFSFSPGNFSPTRVLQTLMF